MFPRLAAACHAASFTRTENRCLALGEMQTTGDIGLLVVPLLIGWLINRGYPTTAFYAVSGAIGITSMGAWTVFQR